MIGFARRLVVIEREGGLRRIRIAAEGTDEDDLIAFPDPSYAVYPLDNADAQADALRLSYESPGTPETIFDYDFSTRLLASRKVKAIPGVDPARYTVERRWATARDGVAVPVTIVADKSLARDGTAPLYLYGYGAYGHGLDPGFNADRVSLLARGFVVAIAHIRGGDELGRAWYDSGKLAHKPNSFADFIDVAQFLIAEAYSAKGRLVASGGSAGGLLVGAVLNMAPELFCAGVAKVPFVDVLTTMLDDSLPLTATEFDEWGNPAESEAYWRIKSYSPYDNVDARDYPHLLVTAGLTDPRVTYWEPAKWVARLRAEKRDDHIVLLKTEMGAGHGGPSGRYKRLEEVALEYAFLLRAFGMSA
jgi:oligopeptidase B